MCEAKCRFDHCLPRLRAAPFIATSAVQHSALIRPVYGHFAPVVGYFRLNYHKAVTVTFSPCNLPVLFHFMTAQQVSVPLVTYYFRLQCIMLRLPSST